jgi:general stress protein 26
MRVDDPAAVDIMRRSLVARVATLSSNGRPSINPLYFVYFDGRIWLGTSDWTLAARNVKADPRVSVLFNIERDRADRRVLRVSGQASVNTDRAVMQLYNNRVARKYILTPRGIFHYLKNFRLLRPMHDYHAQSAAKGLACVIDVIPEQAEFLND